METAKAMIESDCQNLEASTGRLDDALRFDQIPHTAKIFNDFLYDYPKVAAFYSDWGRVSSPLTERARYIAGQQYLRDKVADALERVNTRAGSSELAFENIRTLRNPQSVAIVTGQQAGLFTGPLYAIHKAITAIKLANCLKQEGVQAVPVFWVASEDHDFEEVNHCQVVDVEGRLRRILYEGCSNLSEVPVGHIRLCEGISAKIDELLAALPPSEFRPRIEKDLRESYHAQAGFAEAFASLMARLFKNYGVVLLDPLEPELKEVASPLYVEAIQKAGEIADALVRRSSELVAAGYHAQIHVSDDMAPLFYLDNGRRLAMTRKGNEFVLKGSNRSIPAAELIELARTCSDCFSPNVTLRPIVQDFLLPTAAYIGGPSEIAYFAQIQVVYQILNRPLPCVLPRASFTLIEGRHQKALAKYSLTLPDFFDGLHAAVTRVVERSLDRGAATTFSEAERITSEQLDRVEQALSRADATLAASVKIAREKVLYQFEHLHTKFVHASARRNETAYRQVERAYNTLFPNKNPQERELNIFYL
ncbi:MAG TPA: bacillithiol biosynthesis cysteine-adding enzyme BshC, partial [Blastocatellia bacterium]